MSIRKPLPRYRYKIGIVRVQIARCYVRHNHHTTRFHVIEYRVVGEKTLYVTIERVTPDFVPSFKRGQRHWLETRAIKTRLGRTFTQHIWNGISK